MHSIQVTRMSKGYSNHATGLGYQKKRAEPLTGVGRTHFWRACSGLVRSCISNMDQHQLLLVLRDGMLFSLHICHSKLNNKCFREYSAGALRLDNICLPTRESAVSDSGVRYCSGYPVSSCRLQAGSVLHLCQRPPKTK